jgi:class 3 adenylate cyclase/GAF domain-containing protein
MNWKLAHTSRRRRTRLQRTLHLAFGLFFLFPTAGFIFFSVRYNILGDEYVPYFFLGLLVFSYVGFGILKSLFQRIAVISQNVAGPSPTASHDGSTASASPDELRTIAESFHAIQARFGQALRQLEKKSADISVLKDLSELCYITFNPEEILCITLERALLITNSDTGSVLTLEKTDPKTFVVKATIGLGNHVKVSDRIDFDSSIAKYAVINKSPLVVEDIATDKRFGRPNLAHYGSHSFVCMPIKTSKEVLGVITISSHDPKRIYTHQEIEVLTPLLSNAAFTFENLRLLRENDRSAAVLRSLDKVAKLLNSSFRSDELLHTVLHELHGIVPFEAGIVLMQDENTPETLQVKELLGSSTCRILKNTRYSVKGSVIEKALQQETCLLIDIPAAGDNPLDRDLFAEPGGCGFLVPLRTDGKVFGVLTLVAGQREALSDSQDLVGWIAGGLSLAIDRNRLRVAVAKRDQEMETLRQVGSALASSTFEINKVLQYTMDMIREAMNVEAGSLLFLEDQDLEVAVAFNGGIAALKKFRRKLGQGIAGYAAARGEAVIVNDTETSRHFFPVVDEPSGFCKRSALCVPMISQGRVIGVIEVLNKLNGHFDSNDRELLQAIAASVCIALENARLYKKTVAAAEHEREVRRTFQKFVPKEVVDKIIHGLENGKPEVEELKRITLLNIDIRGFSHISRQIGPHKTVALLNRFFAATGEAVFKHHGIVDKYLGDGFLAIFGAPVSNSDDADNALRAAQEMRLSLSQVNRLLGSELSLTLDMGISVHTGEVVAGNIGFDKKMDYTVIGDAVNTVFRLQAVARSYPNAILVSEATLGAVRFRPPVQAISVPFGFQRELGDLRVYALLEPETTGRPAALIAAPKPAANASACGGPHPRGCKPTATT